MPVGKGFGFGGSDAQQGDAVAGRGQIEIVADMHRRDQKAQFLRQFLADALDPAQQLAVLVAIHQGDQAITDFHADGVQRRHIVPAYFAGVRAISTARICRTAAARR
jgi:hypothetical protein